MIEQGKKIKEKAYLKKYYFDKYGNKILNTRTYIEYVDDKDFKRDLLNFGFEYVSDANSIHRCDMQVKRITKKKNSFFITSYYFTRNLLNLSEQDKHIVREFDSIHSMKFECIINDRTLKSADASCISDNIERFEREEFSNRLTETDKAEIKDLLSKYPDGMEILFNKKNIPLDEEVKFKALKSLLFGRLLGSCMYRVIKKYPKSYFIKDMLDG